MIVSPKRTRQILRHIDDHHVLPNDMTAEEQAALDDLYKVTEDGVYLNSMGELFIGYPETDDHGEIDGTDRYAALLRLDEGSPDDTKKSG